MTPCLPPLRSGPSASQPNITPPPSDRGELFSRKQQKLLEGIKRVNTPGTIEYIRVNAAVKIMLSPGGYATHSRSVLIGDGRNGWSMLRAIKRFVWEARQDGGVFTAQKVNSWMADRIHPRLLPRNQTILMLLKIHKKELGIEAVYRDGFCGKLRPHKCDGGLRNGTIVWRCIKNEE